MTGRVLPPFDRRGRLDVVAGLPAVAGVDTFVVSDPSNVRWATGFTGSNGTLVVGSGGVRLLTDARYRDQAPAELAVGGVGGVVEVVEVPSGEEGDAVWRTVLPQSGRVGLEAAVVSWATVRAFGRIVPGVEFVPTSGVVEVPRARKDAAELARIAAAAAAVDAALARIVPLVDGTRTELDLARALDAALVDAGASGPAFETIVASGPNGALPHARPTDRVVALDDLVVVDVGGVVDGYRSDMTRTFCTGTPTTEAARVWEVVAAAQRAGCAAVRPGAPTSAVDTAARGAITAAGYGAWFTHGTGHGVGLDVHEAPSVPRSGGVDLEVGHVLTVEPGVYLPGRFGVRIEDTVVVTDDGCRSLTAFPTVLRPARSA